GEKVTAELAKDAAKAAARAEGKKVLGMLVPLAGAAVALGAAFHDGYKTIKEARKGNVTGALIEVVHVIGDAAGAFGAPGAVVSILVDTAVIGLHWWTGK